MIEEAWDAFKDNQATLIETGKDILSSDFYDPDEVRCNLTHPPPLHRERRVCFPRQRAKKRPRPTTYSPDANIFLTCIA
eukprot:scaffold26716_cov137-Cylindrotheca_fusiformis.AAC.8